MINVSEIPPFKSKEYRKIVQEVNECFTFSAEAKQEREVLGRKAYKALRAYIDEAKYPFPTKSNVGKFAADSTTFVASQLDSLLQNPPVWRFHPQGGTPRAHAEWMEHLLAYYTEQMPIRSELDDALMQLEIFGTVYTHQHWRIETRTVGARQLQPKEIPLIDPVSGLPMLDEMGEPVSGVIEVPTYYEGEREVYFGPWFRTLHFTECYPDHLEKHLQDGYFFIHRTMRDRRWMKARAREGSYDKKAVARLLEADEGKSNPWEEFSSNTGQRLESTIKWQAEIGLGTQTIWSDIEKRKWFEVLEFWCSDGYVTTVANGSYILRRRKNPFAHGLFPFAMARKYQIPGEHYGMSTWEVAGKLYSAYNDAHNAANTQAMMSVFPPIKRSADVDERQLRQRGIRDIWTIKSPEAVLEFVQLPPDGLTVAQTLMGDIGRELDNLTGASDAYRGAVSSGSATSITTAMQQTGMRLRYHVGNVGELLKDIGQQMQEMLRQHQRKDVTVRVTGDPNATIAIPIEELRDADLVCSPTYSTSQLRILEEKRMLELYELIVRTQEPFANRQGAFEAVVETVAPTRKRQFMKSAEQFAEEQQAAQQAAQEEEMAQMDKMRQAQEYAAAAGRQTAQTNSVVKSAQAQNRPILELAPLSQRNVAAEVDELGTEFANMTEEML